MSAAIVEQYAWAEPVTTLTVSDVPSGAVNLNVDGRPMVGPLQGFGPLWQKRYRVRLSGANVTPAEVVRVWKEQFPRFQPPQNRFYPSLAGVTPGEVVLLNASVGGIPVYAGMLVLYADDEAFTLMTPQGLPESGWFTCSAYVEDGATVVQLESMGRSNDPIYELGFRAIGARAQEQIWTSTLQSLAAYFGVEGQVQLHKTLVDPHLQWSQARNVWYNAGIRTILYSMLTPVRWGRRLIRR